MDVKQFYTDKADTYLAFNSVFRSRQALQAFFETYDGLRPGLRVLDAGCGAGDATLALAAALRRRRLEAAEICAFDLTPAMLSRCQQALARENLHGVKLFEADVLELQRLPPEWTSYDLIVSVAMLEYVPKQRLVTALAALRGRLAHEGRLLIFITRRNWITKPLIETWWRANRYTREELIPAFESAGLGTPRFRRYPASHFWQNVWGHVLESEPATRPARRD